MTPSRRDLLAAAAGATDNHAAPARELASQVLGQTVISDNRAGAGGTLAMPILHQAEPNGYTIAQVPQPVFRAPPCPEGA